jgi:hypothetical protein
MTLRKLRIAWSVAWGLVVVLLLVLWVRSYWDKDTLILSRPGSTIFLSSVRGQIACSHTTFSDMPDVATDYRWEVTARPKPDDVDAVQRGFSFHPGTWDNEFELTFPQWCTVLITAIAAAITWLPSPLKRFTLRTLLIGTTLVAIVLGLIVWTAR